jgi:hypothetical protein
VDVTLNSSPAGLLHRHLSPEAQPGTGPAREGVETQKTGLDGKSYQVQVSGNGSPWTTVYSTTRGDGGTDDIIFTPRTARYLRVYGSARGTTWGCSLWELKACDG